MARKVTFDGITPQHKEPAAPGAPAQAPTAAPGYKGAYRSVGIGLKEQELADVEKLAAEHDLSRNSILRLAVLYFIEQVRAGSVAIDDYKEPPQPAKHRLKRNL